MSGYVGKVGVMDTGESKAIVVLFECERDGEKESYTFSLVDFFSAYSKAVLERDGASGEVRVYLPSYESSDDEAEILPDHVDLEDLADFLSRLESGDGVLAEVDFAA